MALSKHIVFVHGLMLNGSCWKPWEDYFSARGFTCHSPAYPYHEGLAAERRKNIDPRLGTLRFKDVIAHYVSYIDGLPEKPILIGHSMGGGIVQKLLYLQKASAVIALSSAPPKGIFGLYWGFIRSNFPIINPFMGNTPFMPSVNWYHMAVCQKESLESVKQIYEAFVIPESRNLARSIITEEGYIDFKKPHAPLLFIAGTDDFIIPMALNKKNFDVYTDTSSICDWKAFEGRTHFIGWEKGWEEVIAYVADWIESRKEFM